MITIARVKSSHVATLVVVAGIGLFASLLARDCVRDRKVAHRTDADHEIHSYFVAKVKPALAAAPDSEPANIKNPVLAIVPPHEVGLERVDAQLDTAVYNLLEPGERTDHLAGAGTIAIVERNVDSFYAGSNAAGGSVATKAIVTLFDVQSARAVGKLVVESSQQPPDVATQKMVDDYRDDFAGLVAVHLHMLSKHP